MKTRFSHDAQVALLRNNNLFQFTCYEAERSGEHVALRDGAFTCEGDEYGVLCYDRAAGCVTVRWNRRAARTHANGGHRVNRKWEWFGVVASSTAGVDGALSAPCKLVRRS